MLGDQHGEVPDNYVLYIVRNGLRGQNFWKKMSEKGGGGCLHLKAS